jgi:integrase
MNVFNELKKLRPNVKDSSLNNYVVSLKKIHNSMFGIIQIKNFEFLNNYMKVEKSFSNLSPLTQRNYLNSVIVAYDLVKDKNQVILDHYTKLRDDYNQSYIDFVSKNERSTKQKLNWIEYSELVKIKDSFKKKNLEFYSLMSLYLTVPLRNDVANMLIVGKRELNRIKKDAEQFKKYNYFVKGRLDSYLILCNYKTEGTYGCKKIDLNPELSKIMMRWVKKSGNTYLYENIHGDSLTTNEITRMFNTIFKPKRVSTTMLRHIVLSHKFAADLSDRKELALKMGHSVSMAGDYIKI